MRKLALTILLVTIALFSVTSAFAQTAQHSVTLTWTAGSGGGTVAGYNVYRGVASGGPYTMQNPSSGSVKTLNYVDTTSLVEGTTYFYVVTATGPGGESVKSNEVSGLIPFSAPSAPTLAAPVVK